MKQRIFRYYHTLKHLKPIQIRYQLWYRLRNKFFPVSYFADVKTPPFQKLRLVSFPEQYTHYFGNHHFRFLNLEQNFKKEVNWNFSEHGKLWTYHLNYFDYLHQSDMDWETGKELIDNYLSGVGAHKDGMEPYPISLRTINWIKFLAVHNRYPNEVVDSLYAQYLVLLKNLEYHLLGNHLLENGLSLLFGAGFFRDKKMTHLAKEILKRELREQILEDGSHFELSPMYHVIILQRALDGYNLLINNDHGLEDMQELLKEKIQKMVNWLKVMMFSNGEVPMYNDSTSGQALDPKTILDYAEDLGFTPESIELSESGYRKFELGGFELIADVGKVGPDYQPGHAHCDMLSFVLYHEGKPVIVDRGISTYEKNALREEERGTASHNTVMINEQDQSDVWGGFRVGRRAVPEIIEERDNALAASHTGYDHIGCKHYRKWTIQNGIILIEDSAEGSVDKAEAFFHFHPSVDVQEPGNGTFHTENLILKLEGYLTAEIESYMFCLGFNNTTKSKKLRVVFTDQLKITIIEKSE